ncbi:MAG TPA: RNA polymerase sigma factor [Candidatus Polarisedimenticolia bacterium]|jgi:RNA polymerase sigma-70 factor (ECF subfamily)|nr:RNA polymerase sigma factor [Candidatus Polarisedimenticolia bacterium]
MNSDIEKATPETPAPRAAAASPGHVAASDDLAIVEALRRGDEDAFVRLVDLHHATLRRIALLYVSDAAVAEEVVQDTWLVVIQGVWAFEGRSTLKTWILRILANRAKTRAQRENRTISFTEAGFDDAEAPEANLDDARLGVVANPRAFDPAPSPEASVLAEETRERMQKAIDALPAKLRSVLTMRDIEGISSEETCNILGIRETHQRVLLHRARSKVRTALQPYLEGE